jgi:hypothetical protein
MGKESEPTKPNRPTFIQKKWLTTTYRRANT